MFWLDQQKQTALRSPSCSTTHTCFSLPFCRNLFPSNLVAAAFRSVSARKPYFTSPFIITFCLFFYPTCVLCELSVWIYFANHADATPRSFTAAVNPGCNTESLTMPLNEEMLRIETAARLASFPCPLPAVTMAKPFHSSQPSNPPRLAALERCPLHFLELWSCLLRLN